MSKLVTNHKYLSQHIAVATSNTLLEYGWIGSDGAEVAAGTKTLDVYCTAEGGVAGDYPRLLDAGSIIPLTNNESANPITPGMKVQFDTDGGVKIGVSTYTNVAQYIGIGNLVAGATGYFRLIVPEVAA